MKNYVNSGIFIQFLKHFEAWCFNDKSICKRKVMLLLDNCSSHRSQITAKFIEKSKINFLFIPAYSPQLAAVELAFNSLKKRLNHFTKGRTIRLSQEESFVTITSCLRRYGLQEIRSYFRKVFEQIEYYLNLSVENAYSHWNVANNIQN